MKTILKILCFWAFVILCLVSSRAYSQANYYWVGGSGNWSDYENHWATSSGGSAFHASAPTQVDDVFFDENSFSAEGQIVTLDIEGFTSNRIHSMDWRGSNFSPTIKTKIGTSNYLRIHGSVFFHSEMTVEVDQFSLQIRTPDEAAVFDPGGVDLSGTEINFSVTDASSSLSLLDSLSVRELWTGSNITGTFNSNGHPIHVADYFDITQNITGTFDISNSRIYTKTFEISSNSITGDFKADETEVTIIYPEGVTTIQSYDNDPLISK